MMVELCEEKHEESFLPDITEGVKDLAKRIEDFELQLLLSEPYDKSNAILELHPGAGGTESQDWAEMLLRMYTDGLKIRFKVETLDYYLVMKRGSKVSLY